MLVAVLAENSSKASTADVIEAKGKLNTLLIEDKHSQLKPVYKLIHSKLLKAYWILLIANELFIHLSCTFW